MEIKNYDCDLLIIGGGPAGLTAATYAGRAGLETVILEKIGLGGQIISTGEIENMPGFLSITGAELTQRMTEQAAKYGAEILYDEITHADFGDSKDITQKKVVTCESTKISCHAIILAVGASPRKSGAENEEQFIGNGVHFCALCDGNFYKGKDVIVVGGGNSAVEEALYLSDIAKNITIVNVTPDFNAQSVLVEKLKTLPNVKAIYHDHSVVKIISDEAASMVIAIEIKNRNTGAVKRIPCSGMFVAIGRSPNTKLLSGALGLTKGGYIEVNSKLETRIPGVYAAGDCTDKDVRQIVTACSDGAIAATHAAEYVKTARK